MRLISRLNAMARTFALTGVLAITMIARAAPPIPAQKDGDWASLTLRWDKPAAEDGFLGNPIGNGHTGAKIKGGVGNEVVQLNDKWFWSGGPGLTPPDPKRRLAMQATRERLAAGDVPGAEASAKGMWGSNDMGTYLPVGTLALAFDHGEAKVSGYARALDLDRAASVVSYTLDNVNYEREAFASFPDDVVVMRLTGSVPGRLAFTARLAYPSEMEGHGASTGVEGNDLVMRGRAPGNAGWDAARGMRVATRLRAMAQGGTLDVSPDNALRVRDADSVVLILTTATDYSGFDREPGAAGIDPAEHTRTVIDAAAAKTYEQLLAAHLADYRSLFRRVWAEVNGERPNQQVLTFQYARYDMISSSRTGDRPHNQQGMWNHKWKPTSQSAHWLNENVEKYYALIETANLPECGEPLWNWVGELAVRGAEHARVDWGFHGWLAGSCSDIWAKASLAAGNNEWSIWPMGGVWLCNNLFEHYAFSGDRAFLRDRAYPILKGACAFCLDYLVEDQSGVLVTSPSTSPENRFALADGGTPYAVTVGSTSDMAMIRQLFGDTIEAATVLGVDAEFRDELKATLPRLAPFKIGRNGELQEWFADYSRLPQDPRKRFTPHRHASHLLSVWPLAQITERDADLFAAAKRALHGRGTGGYHPDKGAMWARLHEGDQAIAAGDTLPTGERITGMTPPKAAAFPELFVQSHTGAIELLPALPHKWASGRVVGLRARGGYEVGIEWRDGALVACQIDSHLGTTPRVRYMGKDVDLNAPDTRVRLNILATPTR